MTQLVLVRHGETVWHAENRYAGLSDIELTPRGHAQAAQLAAWSSSAAIRLALCRLIGVPLGSYRRLFPRLDNCAVTELRLRDGQVAILQLNSPIGAIR
ncbi:histidine phosphatase family protein [Sphaerisporangium perillae]|uniref:histidine phosphatase family protein n=1 Tax=Sphaerisporangium perillae TaxID=2935860 RepID=UPI0020104C88|nr:phosphoglycerate mutase family protein [Sphaerisporangium perillae]